MAEYNVLWLDDYFNCPVNNPDRNFKDINENYRKAATGFLRDVRKVEESGIHVKGVSCYLEFAEEFKRNADLYQGVVLDLRGMSMSGGDEANDYVVAEAIELVESIKRIPMYVYSANTDSGKFGMTIRHIVEAGRAFDKGESVRNLLNKMLSDFDSSFQFYAGHEYCLKLYNERFLAFHTKPQMDTLVRHYENLSEFYMPYNDMRHILENLTRNLCRIKVLDVDPASVKLNKRVEILAKNCHPLKDGYGNPIPGTIDNENPVVPFSVINQETKNLIRFLVLMTNTSSHFDVHSSANYFGLEYNLNVLKATYHAFFAVLKWYYTFMHNHSLQNNRTIDRSAEAEGLTVGEG